MTTRHDRSPVVARFVFLWKRQVLAMALLAVLVFTAFAPTLGAAPIWDDEYLTTRNQNLASWHGVLRLVTTDIWSSSALEEDSAAAVNVSYRPLSSLSYALNRLVLGNTAASYHAVNVALHFAVVLLLFLVIVRRKIADVTVALAACALFATMPLVSEPVSWLAGRYDLLAAVFSLLALVANGRGSRVNARVWTCALACAAATLSKEPYVVIAAFVVLDDVLVFRRGVLAEARKYVAVACGVASCFVLRHLVHVPQPARPFDQSLQGLAAAYAFAWQTLAPLAVIPNDLCFFHTYAAAGVEASLMVIGALALVVVGAIVWRRRAPSSVSRGAVVMGALWCVLAMVPAALAGPTLRIIGDRYAYLPLIGAVILVAGLLMEVRKRVPFLRLLLPIAVFGLVALQCTTLESRLAELQTSDSMLLATLAREPDNFTALSLWGSKLARTGRYDEAEATLQHARRVAPLTGTIDTGLCFVHLRQRRYGEAEVDGRRAVQQNPHNPRAWLNLASALVNQDKAPEAKDAATEALHLRPRYTEARVVRALAWEELGDMGNARVDLEAAVASDPSHAQARALLAHLK